METQAPAVNNESTLTIEIPAQPEAVNQTACKVNRSCLGCFCVLGSLVLGLLVALPVGTSHISTDGPEEDEQKRIAALTIGSFAVAMLFFGICISPKSEATATYTPPPSPYRPSSFVIG